MKALLLSIMLLASTSAWSMSNDSLNINEDKALTEMRINNVVYVGRITSIQDDTVTFHAVNIIRVESNENNTVYINGEKTKIKSVIIK